MKKKILMLFVCLLAFSKMQAQTSKELIGKWQLVKWTVNGKEKSIMDEFKTDQIFQIFKEKNQFVSINGSKVNKGKWKLSSDNQYLNIKVGMGTVVNFKIDYFDSRKRIITQDPFGTLEYKKVDQ